MSRKPIPGIPIMCLLCAWLEMTALSHSISWRQSGQRKCTALTRHSRMTSLVPTLLPCASLMCPVRDPHEV